MINNREEKGLEGENITKEAFKSFYNLELKKIKETGRKKDEKFADFFVFENNKKVAVCEVKTLEDTEHSYLRHKENDSVPQRLRAIGNNSKKIESSFRSRIAEKINKAGKQLKKYCFPKILVFVCFDLADCYDMERCFREDSKQFLGIDLVVWIDMFNNNSDNKKKPYLKFINKKEDLLSCLFEN